MQQQVLIYCKTMNLGLNKVNTYFYLENMYEVWFGSNCIEWIGYKWKYTHGIRDQLQMKMQL
jgi:hypothetical protein